MIQLEYFIILIQVIRISIPYLLAAMGGMVSERAGIVNIALEGMMLNGALGCVLTIYYTGNPWLGVVGGITAGFLTAIIHAVTTVKFYANQIISGVAINLFSVGITKYLLKLIFGSTSNSARVEGLPMLGGAQGISPVMILALLLVPITFILLQYTKYGLRLKSVGEKPEASESVGINVLMYRYWGVLISGMLAGLAGSYLALEQHQFTDNMTGGRGYIALAAMILGKWNPWGCLAASLLFGAAETLNIHLQSSGSGIPNQFIQIIPYLLTVIVLVSAIGKSISPASTGKPYEKN